MAPELEKLPANGASVAHRTPSRRESTSPPWTVIQHPLAQQALSRMTADQVALDPFRASAFQLLCLLVFEATRSVSSDLGENSSRTSVAQPTGIRPLILLSVTGQGLAPAHRLREVFPDLVVGAVSFARSTDGSVCAEPRLHLPVAPVFGDAHVILFTPVVTTGFSTQKAIGVARRAGATDLSLATFAINEDAIALLQSGPLRIPILTALLQRSDETLRSKQKLIQTLAERVEGRDLR